MQECGHTHLYMDYMHLHVIHEVHHRQSPHGLCLGVITRHCLKPGPDTCSQIASTSDMNLACAAKTIRFEAHRNKQGQYLLVYTNKCLEL